MKAGDQKRPVKLLLTKPMKIYFPLAIFKIYLFLTTFGDHMTILFILKMEAPFSKKRWGHMIMEDLQLQIRGRIYFLNASSAFAATYRVVQYITYKRQV